MFLICNEKEEQFKFVSEKKQINIHKYINSRNIKENVYSTYTIIQYFLLFISYTLYSTSFV